jgi:hypothetical protein
MACRPGYVGTDESELKDFEGSCTQAGRRLTSFGRMPLLIISQDTDVGDSVGAHSLGCARRREKSVDLLCWSVALQLVWSADDAWLNPGLDSHA